MKVIKNNTRTNTRMNGSITNPYVRVLLNGSKCAAETEDSTWYEVTIDRKGRIVSRTKHAERPNGYNTTAIIPLGDIDQFVPGIDYPKLVDWSI